MNTSIATIEQVSKEVKTKISKLGKEQLVKKFSEGKLTTEEEVVAARFYLLKRESLTEQEIDKIEATQYVDLFFPEGSTETEVTTTTSTFGKHRSEMTEEEIKQAEERQKAVREDAKLRKQFPANVEGSEEFIEANEVIEVKAPKAKKEKQPEQPIVKLTEQEFKLFEKIKKNSDLAKLQKSYESLREFKGVLGSLGKKQILSYTETTLTILKLGQDMIDGKMPYKKKAKHEQNFFKKQRLVIDIDGKPREKSAYVRMLLQKNNQISCAEINEKLTEIGFPKLYHSELQRCKQQLGIQTIKDLD